MSGARIRGRRSIVWGLAAALGLLVAGDGARTASLANSAIDPFEILNLQVKPNVLILLDNTGSMQFGVGLMPGFRRYPVGGDDTMSRIYNAKQAVAQVVSDNKDKMNFGIVAFNDPNANRPINANKNEDADGLDTTQTGGGASPNGGEGGERADGPLVYVSRDAAAQIWSWNYGGLPLVPTLANGDMITPKPFTCPAAGGTTNTLPNAGSGLATNQVLGFFCDIRDPNSGAIPDWDQSDGAPLTTAIAAETFQSFGNRGVHAFPYPEDLTWNTAVTLNPSAVAPFSRASGLTPETCPEGVPEFSPGVASTPTNNPTACRFHPPICAPGTDCRFYMQSRFLRSGKLYTWDHTKLLSTQRLVSITPFACPLPPKDLTSFNPDVAENGGLGDGFGDQPRPCFAFEDLALGPASRAVYYYSSAWYAGGGGCPGTLLKIEKVADCSAPPVDPANPQPGRNGYGVALATRPEMPVSVAGGVPTVMNLTTNSVTPLGGINPGAPTPGPAAFDVTGILGATGLRAGGGTPMGKMFNDIASAAPALFAPRRPNQKNFVIIVTDGNDRCMGAGGFNNFSSEDISSRYAAQQAQALYENTDPGGVHQAEVMVVAFTNDVNVTFANRMSQAGSGGDASNTPATGVVDCNINPTGGPCRNAFVATTAAQLTAQLRAALEQISSAGEFSSQTQGSVTESVFEFVSLAGTPGPPVVSFDPLDPVSRFASTFPITVRSTFVMPTFDGQLKAFKSGSVTPVWDAGQVLRTNVVTGPGGMGIGQWTFAQLHGGVSNPPKYTPDPAARIRRRIFTTVSNGVRPANVPLWPPTTTGPSAVAPSSVLYPAGLLDGNAVSKTGLAIGGLTFAQLQTQFLACRGIVPANIPLDCSNALLRTGRAMKEAREIILAYTAGAKVVLLGNLPVRNGSGEILYQARPWLLGESTLSTPGFVGAPGELPPTLHGPEWTIYRDGPRDVSNRLVGANSIENGFGLRNPERDDPAPDLSGAQEAVMTVLYVGANDMLHAFRAGPQACTSLANCPPVGSEGGGTELWGFVPYDLLPAIKDRRKGQSRLNPTFMVASSLRFGDVFIPGPYTAANGVALTGKWRTLMYFGRGPGGKYLTGMDVTGPGPFTRKALDTKLPDVLWNRGNPDSPPDPAGDRGVNDATAYATMGESWSVGALVPVDPTKAFGSEWVLWVGSGFSDTLGEGTTFYTLDAVTGDALFAVNVGSNGGVPRTNSLPAAVAGFVPNKLGQTQVNAADGPATAAFVGDLHGRLWKFDVNDLSTQTLVRDYGGNQPIGVAVSALNLNTDGTILKPHVYGVTGNDNRIFAPPVATPPFVMFGLRDDGASSTELFTPPGPVGFTERFRGSTQPLVANVGAGDQNVVFFVGTQFNPAGTSADPAADPCTSSFDSVLFALNAKNGGAAYDLQVGPGDDRSAILRGQKVQNITARGGKVVLDSGLNAGAPPPPPPPPTPQGTNALPSVFTTGTRYGSPVCNW